MRSHNPVRFAIVGLLLHKSLSGHPARARDGVCVMVLLPGRFLQPVAENRARGMNIFARLNIRHPRGGPRLGTTERARVLSTTMALATENGLAGVSLRLISEKCGLPLAVVTRSFGDLDTALVVAAVSGAQDRVMGAEDCSTPDELADLEMSLLHHFHRNRSVYAELLSSPLAARVSAGLSAVGQPLEQANMRLFQVESRIVV
jgi:hypothetical protein